MAYDMDVPPREIALKEGVPAGRFAVLRHDTVYKKARRPLHGLDVHHCFLKGKKSEFEGKYP